MNEDELEMLEALLDEQGKSPEKFNRSQCDFLDSLERNFHGTDRRLSTKQGEWLAGLYLEKVENGFD